MRSSSSLEVLALFLEHVSRRTGWNSGRVERRMNKTRGIVDTVFLNGRFTGRRRTVAEDRG